MYGVSDALPVESYPGGTSVLVSAPGDVDGRGILLDLLAEGHRRGEGTVAFTTRETASAVRAALADRADGVDGRVAVVDCAGSDAEDPPEGMTRHVSSPGDFTSAGVAISELVEELGHRHDGIVVGVHSVSDLLEHADVKTVFRFLHVLTGRIGAADALGLATLDPGAHDAQTVSTVRQLFDGLVEVETGTDGPRVRASGPSDVETDWQPY